MNVNEYWKKFLKEKNLPEDTEYMDAFCFAGFTPEESDELANLVLEGKKKATTSIYLKDEVYPEIGTYSIVLNSVDEPLCVIQTVKYSVMKFKDMDFETAQKEGEDKLLETWISNHTKVFEEEGKQMGYSFSEESLIFFEEFEVVYK